MGSALLGHVADVAKASGGVRSGSFLLPATFLEPGLSELPSTETLNPCLFEGRLPASQNGLKPQTPGPFVEPEQLKAPGFRGALVNPKALKPGLLGLKRFRASSLGYG